MRESRLRRALELVDREAFDEGAAELRLLLPDLEGREELEALLSLGRAALWTERTEEALACGERALAAAEAMAAAAELVGPALALLGQVHGQRGEEGDLSKALELGDLALERWVDEERPTELAIHRSLHGLATYWVGDYERAVELTSLGGDGATAGLALTALGRHEEAIAASDRAIDQQREAGSTIGTAYALDCSTAALRDLLETDEARRRNEEANELYRTVGFESGVMQGEIDLIYADLIDEDIGGAERTWPSLWGRVRDATGWERWLAPARLSVARAEILIRQERWEAAAEAAGEAIDIATAIGRPKVDASARLALGEAQLSLGHAEDAVGSLRAAAATADRLRHPPTRWRAHASLARAFGAVGNDAGAARELGEAEAVLRGFASALRPDRAEAVLSAPDVRGILGEA